MSFGFICFFLILRASYGAETCQRAISKLLTFVSTNMFYAKYMYDLSLNAFIGMNSNTH